MSENHEVHSRERRIDLSKLPQEHRDAILVSLGEKISKTFTDAVDYTNRMLHVYGMNLKMVYHIEPLDGFKDSEQIPVIDEPIDIVDASVTFDMPPAPKKRGRPKKHPEGEVVKKGGRKKKVSMDMDS
jgi:hypothetical protein